MKELFSPTKIGNLDTKNHFVRAAAWVALADEDGSLNPNVEKIYEELAEGGVGIIQTGYARVRHDEAPNPNMIGAYDDKFIPSFQKFTQKIHGHDAKIMLQIAYGGSMTGFHNKKVWSPSGIKPDWGIESVEITESEIKELVNDHAQAARRAKEGGFDGVVVHSAHGYFLSQFLSPAHNQRQDSYGGSIENRCRFQKEIIQAIRKEVGDDYPIWMKINSQDYTANGLQEDDMIEIVKILYAAGLDAVDISGGDATSKDVLTNNLGPSRKTLLKPEDQSYNQKAALRLAKESECPIVLTGGHKTLETMYELYRQGVGFFALARPLTAEPDLINLWAKDYNHKMKCVSCNMCHKTVGKRCILNPGTIKVGA